MSLQPWLADNWRQLDAALAQQRLHHGLLFVAPAGYGKRVLATALAVAALCQQRQPDGHACGRCRACLLFAAGTHPDFTRVTFELRDDGKPRTEITIDQNRTVTRRPIGTAGREWVAQLRARLGFPGSAQRQQRPGALAEEPTPSD